MQEKYEKWIKENVTKPRLQCAEYTLKMQKQFPELKRIRGHYFCDREHPHWWLIDEDDNIIDPTIVQFPSIDGIYIPWDETQKEPIGKCLNCGELIYDCIISSQICSKICEISFLKSLQ